MSIDRGKEAGADAMVFVLVVWDVHIRTGIAILLCEAEINDVDEM